MSKDNLRGPKRFLLGLYAPGKTTNSTQLVIRLTPIPAADPNAGAASASSLQTSRPLTLDEAEPYGVYFFQSSMLRVLTREGIHPKKKSQQGRSSLLKVQPTDNPGPVGSSQLRGRSDACFLINMHASITAGTEWIKYTNDGCYGTDHIPITPQFLLVAFRFTSTGSEEIWSAHSAVAPAATASTPAAFIPHSTSIGSAQQDSRADVRLRAHLHAPPATIIPAEDDDELLDAPPDIDVPVSTAVSSALTHLEQAIDNMHSASPTPLSFDPLFYLALSSLPLTYPWPILTIDLKNFLPLMDRHVLTHLVAAQASVNPRFQHPAPVLSSFFKDLAHAVVHTILAPLNSQHMRPNLPPRVFTAEFWHAHFNYAALRTDPALAAIGSMDGLAGDQICQWNSVAPASILPPTHLSVFIPPPLGAFVLANHQSHEDFKSTPASASHSSPIFSVQQNIQFPLPQVFGNQDELLSLARLSASEGYLSEEVIPFLGHSNQQMTFKKVRWALRFPLPPPSKDPAARRFSATPAFRQGPRSGEALEGAIRVAAPLTYAQEDSVHLPQSHFLKLPSFDRLYGKITRNVNPSLPDEHVVRWLRAQAPRLAQRDEGDKSTIPAGLYAFFCGNISLPQVVELIKARHSHDEKSVQLMQQQSGAAHSSAPSSSSCRANGAGTGQWVSAPSNAGCSTYRSIARGL